MQVTQLKPRPIGIATAIAAMLVFAGAAIANGGRFPGLMIAIPALLLLLRVIFTGYFPFEWRRATTVDAVARTDELTLGGAPHAVFGDSARIVLADRLVVPGRFPAADPLVQVAVDRRGWGLPIVVRLPLREAEKLVKLVGGDVAGPRRVRPMNLTQRPSSAVGIALAIVFGALPVPMHPGLAWMIFVPTLAFTLFSLANAFTEIIVGRDGVTLRRRFSARFISFRDLADARVLRRAIAITHARGATFVVAMSPMLRDATVARIREGIALHQHAAPPVELRGLEPPTSDLAGYVRKLRQAATSTYRDEVADPEALAAVLAEPRNAPRVRVSAAIALRAKGDDRTREKLRLAARDAADPELRKALEVAALDEATDDDLARRLGAIGSQKPR